MWQKIRPQVLIIIVALSIALLYTIHIRMVEAVSGIMALMGMALTKLIESERE